MPVNEDIEIWQAYAKGVKRLEKQLPSAIAKEPNSKRHSCGSRNPEALSFETVLFSSKTSDIGNNAWIPAFAGMTPKKQLATLFDRRREKQLRQGALSIDARLDLHGLTQRQAYTELEKFMAAQVKLGHRNLLVITGKGSMGQSVLRSNLPQWLESLPSAAHILDLRSAAPKHGGAGAFYVILKRPRD
jgi:DNA-nicking Smr family endonuclease